MKKKMLIIGLSLTMIVGMTGFALADAVVEEESIEKSSFGRGFYRMKDFMEERFEGEEGEFYGLCHGANFDEEELQAFREEMIQEKNNQLDELYEEGRISEEQRDEMKKRLEDNAYLLDGRGPHHGMGGRMKWGQRFDGDKEGFGQGFHRRGGW